MAEYDLDFDDNPKFNTVLGLSNTTFDPNNIVSGRMVTEQQLQALWQRIYDDELIIDRCCRDIILWEAHVQIVRLNTNTLDPNLGFPTAGGVAVSPFADNVSVGVARRGLPFTVTFPLKWNSSLYTKFTPEGAGVMANNIPSAVPVNYTGWNHLWSKYIQYRFIYQYEDEGTLSIYDNCQGSSNTRCGFFRGINGPTAAEDHRGPTTGGGRMVNTIDGYGNVNWYSFVHDIADDGTVTLRDNRRRTDFEIVKFYTQWCLKRCADDTILPEPQI